MKRVEGPSTNKRFTDITDAVTKLLPLIKKHIAPQQRESLGGWMGFIERWQEKQTAHVCFLARIGNVAERRTKACFKTAQSQAENPEILVEEGICRSLTDNPKVGSPAVVRVGKFIASLAGLPWPWGETALFIALQEQGLISSLDLITHASKEAQEKIDLLRTEGA